MREYWLQTGKAQFSTQLALGLSMMAAFALSALTPSFSQPVTYSFMYSTCVFLNKAWPLNVNYKNN